MVRALAVLRALVLANTLAVFAARYDGIERPVLGLAVMGFLVVWSVVVVVVLRRARRRTLPVLVLDLAVGAGTLLASPVVEGPDFTTSLPSFWVMAPLLVWAVCLRWPGGLLAAVVLSACDLAVRPEITQTNLGNVFLVLIGGPIVGYLCGSLQEMAAQRDAAERAAAVAEERARLARAVHDGVLQVLAMVQRRGPSLGPDGAELGRLAGEQESSLRTLINRQDALVRPESDTTLDLAEALAARVARRPPAASLVGTGAPVLVPAEVATELVDAVGACLDNVARHVGDDAPAFVLLEDTAAAVVLTVRDTGPGIAPGRLERAEADGRLGVTGSIRGRLADLGGTAELSTGAGGTSWELCWPRPGAGTP
jgi:signal transduction histidine kinase